MAAGVAVAAIGAAKVGAISPSRMATSLKRQHPQKVNQPKPANRDLYHDNAPCPESCGPTQVADAGR